MNFPKMRILCKLDLLNDKKEVGIAMSLDLLAKKTSLKGVIDGQGRAHLNQVNGRKSNHPRM